MRMKSILRILAVAAVILAASSTVSYAGGDGKKKDKDAQHRAIVEKIESGNFDIIITQNVPKTSNERVTYYSSGEYNILVRGNRAICFIPGVFKGGTTVFGGDDTLASPTEIVEMSCEKVSLKKISHTYRLKNSDGEALYDVTLVVSENGTAKITVDRMPMIHFKFYGEISIVNP